jgi:hypothetical protein
MIARARIAGVALGVFISAALPLAPAAHAQGGRAVETQNVDAMTDRLFKRLFEGITLTPAQQKQVRSLIRETQSAQNAAANEPDGFDKIIALQAKRDSSLTVLLPPGRDRETFRARAAEMFPKKPPKP